MDVAQAVGGKLEVHVYGGIEGGFEFGIGHGIETEAWVVFGVAGDEEGVDILLAKQGEALVDEFGSQALLLVDGENGDGSESCGGEMWCVFDIDGREEDVAQDFDCPVQQLVTGKEQGYWHCVAGQRF